MRKIFTILLALTITVGSFAQMQGNTVNAIIGDISYVDIFGSLPDENSDEATRIQAHLFYVETVLRNKDLSHLNATQKTNREKALSLLHTYWNNGVFPSNMEYNGRRPCFIDGNGNICAVGYLIEQTAGRAVAEEINAAHQYDYLLEMNNKTVEAWADEFGFSLEECAMIQPAYAPPPGTQPTKVPVKKDYGVASGVLGGASIGVNLINLSGKGGSNSKWVSYTGLAAGTAQVILGITNIKKDETFMPLVGWPTTKTYKAQNNLSYINIAVGTTTIVTSAFNLWLNNKIKDKRTSLNAYSYTGVNNKISAGLSFARIL